MPDHKTKFDSMLQLYTPTHELEFLPEAKIRYTKYLPKYCIFTEQGAEGNEFLFL